MSAFVRPREPRWLPRGVQRALLIVVGLLIALAASSGGAGAQTATPAAGIPASPSAATSAPSVDGLVDIGDGLSLHLRCTGSGSPTVVMEAGDGDVGDTWFLVEPAIAAMTRTCVYDRANLGGSGPAPGPRGLAELVGDFERLLESAAIPGPYVLVATSGGGYIAAGYAVEHPDQIAGIVLLDVGAPFRRSPSRTDRGDRLGQSVER